VHDNNYKITGQKKDIKYYKKLLI